MVNERNTIIDLEDDAISTPGTDTKYDLLTLKS